MACGYAFFIFSSTAARAADDFLVSVAQLQALGVQLQKLGLPIPIEGLSYPAKVVLPPRQESIVSTPVAGVVDQLLVSENESVRLGQPLFRLASPELAELQLKLMEAASKSQLSQKTLARERQLFSEGITPERRVQEAGATAEQDLARVRHAESSLKLAGVDAASVQKIAQGVALQEGLYLRAKTAGIIYAIEVRLGQRVQDAQALARIADTRKLWLDIQIPIDLRSKLALAGGAVRVVDREVAALTSGAGLVASDNQTLSLRAEVTRGVQLLRPGEFVQVRVPFVGGAAGWSVPLQSVVRQGNKAYLFVRTTTGFQATQVTILESAGQSVRVNGKLMAHQEIATASVVALKAAWLDKSGGN
jgi:multidrug efflux pump subunit AcrA (membrane-fusion protein)